MTTGVVSMPPGLRSTGVVRTDLCADAVREFYREATRRVLNRLKFASPVRRG